MPLWKIAWRSIQRRSLASVLTTLSMALGVMLVVAVLLIVGVVDDSFRSNSSLGYDTIVGAKGGKLQLVLNTVYYLSTPVENLDYEFYQEFLPAADRDDSSRDGEFAPYAQKAVPVCLGDYYENYRVVGTTADLFDFVYDARTKKSYEFKDGRNFARGKERTKDSPFEAILGAKVARETGLKVGDEIKPSHGSPEGLQHDAFQIVGILASSGTPNDRGVFVDMEGFNLIPEHIRKDGKKEITSLLVKTTNVLYSAHLVNELNEGKDAQAVKPIMEIYKLFELIVSPIRNLLLVITFMICVVSGVSILVSIYNSMSDRKYEIAIMRSLGAGRSTVMAVVLLESVILSMAGGLLGWLGGHALIGLASGEIEDRTGVAVSSFDLAPPLDLSYLLGSTLGSKMSTELWLVPALIVLAIVVGFLPALSAYRTDVAKALQSSP